MRTFSVSANTGVTNAFVERVRQLSGMPLGAAQAVSWIMYGVANHELDIVQLVEEIPIDDDITELDEITDLPED